MSSTIGFLDKHLKFTIIVQFVQVHKSKNILNIDLVN